MGQFVRLTVSAWGRKLAPMRRFAVTFLAALAFSLNAAPAAFAEKAMLANGRAIAQKACGRCHAVGRAGESPNPKSPPFRTLAQRYPLASLEEALGEGIVVGHEGSDMPQFRLGTAQIEALLAYLGSIQQK